MQILPLPKSKKVFFMKSVDIDTAIAELDKALEENQVDVDTVPIDEGLMKAAPTDLLLHPHLPTAEVSAPMGLNVDPSHIAIPYLDSHIFYMIDAEAGMACAYDIEGNHRPESDFQLSEDYPDENTWTAYDLQGNRCPEDDIVIAQDDIIVETISDPMIVTVYDKDGNRKSPKASG